MKKLFAIASALALFGGGCALSSQTQVKTEANPGSTTAAPEANTGASAGTKTENSAGAKVNVGVDVNGLGASVRASATIRASIQGFAFTPATITAKKGDQIVFTNNDGVSHTVTADDGTFASGQLGQGQSFTLDTSTVASGSYAFHCSNHPSMTGTVVVE